MRGSIKTGILILLTVITAGTQAKDSGFRYQNGVCVNAQGQPGLNVGFIGPCSDLRDVILSGFDFTDDDLSGSRFENSDLQTSIFKNADLTGVSFAGANLSGIDFSGSRLHGTSFKGSILRNAHFAGADIQQADFSSADLSEVLLSFAVLKACLFNDAKLPAAQLDQADLSLSHFVNADLNHANLQSANLTGADLGGANLQGADLSKADLSQVLAGKTKFAAALLRSAKMTSGKFRAAAFRQAHLESAVLSQANLSGADFRSAVLSGTQIDGTTLTGALFNKRSVLPFTNDEATKRGMQFKLGGNVFVLWDVQDENFTAFIQALRAADLDVDIDKTDESQFAGMVDLSQYSSVLHLDGMIGNCQNKDVPLDGQNALNGFVKNGGLFIQTEWSTCRYTYGLLQQMRDILLFDRKGEGGGTMQLSIPAARAGDPLLEGVAQQFSVDAHFNVGQAHVFPGAPSRVLLQDAQGSDVMAVREFGAGHVLGFSFACNSKYPCLQNPDIQRLFINALNSY